MLEQKKSDNLLIYVGETKLYPLNREKTTKIFLENNGKVITDELVVHDDRQRNFRRMYDFSRAYLENRKMPYDISRFFVKNLEDIFSKMKHKKQKNISFDALADIIEYQNQIARIREAIIERSKKTSRIRWIKNLKTKEEKNN